MRRKLNLRAALAAAALTISCSLAATWSATPAEAAGGGGDCSTGGGSSGGGGGGSGGNFQIWVALNTHTDMCSGGGNASASDGTSGTPVQLACWWAPVYSPSGLQGYVNSMGSQSSLSNWQFMLMNNYDKNGSDPLTAGYTSTQGPPWESYNIGAAPGGEWWGMVLANNPGSGLQACLDTENARGVNEFYWVADNGQTAGNVPTTQPGITPEVLAQYIESVINLPSAQVSSSQSGTATVGMPIWYWQAGGTSTTLEVTNICAWNVCVDFKAQAISFTIDPGGPGTADNSGCNLNTGSGDLGAPWTEGGKMTCGVTYNAPTTGVSPSVVTTWHVSISWPGGSWSPPQDHQIPTQIGNYPVQEIQAVNRTGTATP